MTSFVFRGHSLHPSRDDGIDRDCEQCAKRLKTLDSLFSPARAEHYRCDLCGCGLHKTCLMQATRVTLCPVSQVANNQAKLDWGSTEPAFLRGRPTEEHQQGQQKCGQCGEEVMTGAGRFCNYYARYCCRLCHWNDKAVVPALLLATGETSLLPVCRMALGLIRACRGRDTISLESPLTAPFIQRLQDSPPLRLSGGSTGCLDDVINARCKLRACLTSCWPCPALRDYLIERVPGSQRYAQPDCGNAFTLDELLAMAHGRWTELVEELDRVELCAVQHKVACLECTPRVCPVCLDVQRRLFRHSEGAAHCRGCNSVYHRTCRYSIRACRVCQCQSEVRRANQLIGGPISYDPQLLALYQPNRSAEEQLTLLRKLLLVTPSSELHLTDFGIYRLLGRRRDAAEETPKHPTKPS